MPRPDLLALTDEDLIALSNRGTVKRARKELESGLLTYEIAEDAAGNVAVAWCDGIACRFLAGKTIHDATCSSGGLGITRHIIRSVLAYQETNANAGTAQPATGYAGGDGPVLVASPPTVWDPGRITDEQLIAAFTKPAVARARARFEQGVLVELTRGAKPTARFLDEACTVRFPVPGDLGYATADCLQTLWSTWIPLAVWSFRELPAEQVAGLVSIQLATPTIPTKLFEDVQALLDELCRDGLAGLAPSWGQRLQRLEQRLRDQGLAWPADIGMDIGLQLDAYRRQDASFDPDHLVLLCGELLARMQGIVRGITPVPQILIRGTKSDRPTEIRGGRFAGIGLGVEVGRRHTTLRAYLQETNSGNVVAVERVFPDPEPTSGATPRSFAELGSTVLTGGVSIGALGMSQLLVRAGKRTSAGRLILPRLTRDMTVHPQSFQWEQFKAPFAVESLEQVRARLCFLPPSYLRPRRPTENLHGIAIAGVDDVQFDFPRQRLTATVTDARGDTATLIHPFLSRGAAGFTAFHAALIRDGMKVRFVAGHVQDSGRSMMIRPVLLVVHDEADQASPGSVRRGINPWIPGTAESDAEVEIDPGAGTLPAGASTFMNELQRSIADILLTGLARGTDHAKAVADRAEEARRFGFVRIADAIGNLAEALAGRHRQMRWDPAAAVSGWKRICIILRVASD